MKQIKPIGRYFAIYSAVLVYLELVLRFQMHGGITGKFMFFLCFVPAQALVLTLLSGFFKSGKRNTVTASALILLLEVYYIAQLIYYRNFGSLFSASMMGMGMEAVGNFSWVLVGVIRDNIAGIYFMLLPVFAVGTCSFMGVLKQERMRHSFRLLLLLLTVPVWFLGVQATRLDGMGRQSAHSVYRDTLSDTDNSAAHLGALTTTLLELYYAHFGGASPDDMVLAAVDMSILTSPGVPAVRETPEPAGTPGEESQSVDGDPADGQEQDACDIFEPVPQILEEIDLKKLADGEETAELKNLSLFLDARGATQTNEYTGLFEGYNLIYICAEAFCTYAIDEQVTPTLFRMANQGIILNNYYNSFQNTTTNGEFAFATGLWPDLSRWADEGRGVGTFAQSAKCFMPMGLGDLFRDEGVPAFGYHNYYGEYYRRNLSWPNLGYECKFHKAGMDFSDPWPASDLELMRQSVDDYIDLERFHAYYMTFSGHGDYSSANAIYRKNIDDVKAHMKEGYCDNAYGYMAGNRELDLGMEYLLERLEEAGKLENTVIVIAGDHFPYNLSEEARNQFAGHELDQYFEMYRSTCIIFNAGLKENIVTDVYCSNVDILPTMLNLFGIQYDSRLLIGRDIFSEGVHKAVIYNKSFITDLVRYNSRTGEVVWFDQAEQFTDEVKNRYLETMIELVKSEFYASMQIIGLNYYQYVWYNSGLMTQEELKVEEERAQEVQTRSEQYEGIEAMLNPTPVPTVPPPEPPAPAEGEQPGLPIPAEGEQSDLPAPAEGEQPEPPVPAEGEQPGLPIPAEGEQSDLPVPAVDVPGEDTDQQQE